MLEVLLRMLYIINQALPMIINRLICLFYQASNNTVLFIK